MIHHILLALFISSACLLNAEARPLEALPQQAPLPGDWYSSFIYRQKPVSDLREFATQTSFGLASYRPWNGSYWPTYKGMLASRYADVNAPNSNVWSDNRDYFRAHPPTELVNAGQVDTLAPSEKYDLLSGDANWSLTLAMWDKGQQIFNNQGGVPTWFGICHGWSAATHMHTPEPQHPVTVMAADGAHTITFFPSDIEALVSYLWAASSPDSILIGNRCVYRHPGEDGGRITDPACADSNPMTWHMTVLNRVGRDGESFVMDSSMNSEVWNYAVDSYMYRYYNPKTGLPTSSLEDAAVSREDFPEDPFADYRSSAAKYIVGVNMDVFMPAATEPTHYNPVASKLYKTKNFVYDLELDANFKPVGGEWHSIDRPDFMWTYKEGAKAFTSYDVNLPGEWTASQPMPAEWISAAHTEASTGRVLSHIVNQLIEWSIEPATATP